jgi:hypothetical protein
MALRSDFASCEGAGIVTFGSGVLDGNQADLVAATWTPGFASIFKIGPKTGERRLPARPRAVASAGRNVYMII